MPIPTLEQFLAGHVLAFKSLSGHDRLARFHASGDGVPWMEFSYPTGKLLTAPIMSHGEATAFYESTVADMVGA